MAIKVQGTTVIDDSRDISNVGVATVGILSVGSYIYDSNGVFGTSNQVLTSVPGIGVSWANQSGSGGASEYYTANAQYSMSGGGTVTFDGSNIKWSNRVILIPVEKTEFGADGYINIDCPTSGTIPFYKSDNTLGTQTCTSNGIPFNGWYGLWYRVTPGQTAASVASKFALVDYRNSNWSPDEGWVLIAIRNGDGTNGGHLKWLPGQISFPDAGGVYDSRYATSNWQDNITEGNTSAEVVDTGSDGHFKVTTEGTERLRIAPNGSVGIGTTNPVGESVGTTQTLHLDGSTAALRVGPYYTSGSDRDNILLVANNYDTYIRSNNERFHFYNASGDIAFHGTSDAENVRFTAAGDVGIGIDNPSYKLHIETTNADGIFLDDSSTAFDAPHIRVRGKRSDNNFSQAFSGQLILEKNQTNGPTIDGIHLGAIIFGGNYDASPGVTTGMTYGASIGAISEGEFSGISTAPTALVFRTGTVGLGTLGEANVNYGDTESLRINSNNNVLIGSASDTGTASQKLQVTGGAYVSGNLGVGNTNPTARLDVRRDASTAYDPTDDDAQRSNTSTISIRNEDGTTNSFAQLTFDTAGTNQAIARIVAIRSGTSSNDLAFVTEHSNTKAERLRIKSDGKVGIGTDNPSQKLDVNGVGRFTSNGGTLELVGTDHTYIEFFPDGYSAGRKGYFGYPSASIDDLRIANQISGANIELYTTDNGSVLVNTTSETGTASQSLQVSGGAYVSGNLGIGATNPGAKLDVTGDIRLSAADPEIEFNSGGPRLKVPAANTLTIHTGGGLNSTTSEVIRVNTTGVGINSTAPTAKLDVNGDVAIASTVSIGTTIDIVPYNDLGMLSFEASQGQLFAITNNLSSGSIFSVNPISGIPIIDVHADRTIQLNPYGGNTGIGTTNPTAKLDVNGTLNVSGVSTFGGNVDLGDNDRLRFGDGTDLQIYHDGGNSLIVDSGTGNLYIAGDNSLLITNISASETKAKFITDGAVELYYDNSKKFETTGAGVTITGITSTTVLHASAGTYDAGQDTRTDSAIVIRTEGKIYTQHGSGPSAGYLRNLISNNNGAITIGQTATSLINAVDLYPGTSGSINLYHGGGDKKFETTSSGVTVTGTVTADGLSLGDNEYAYFGAGNDLEIYHDGSNSRIRDVGVGDLSLEGQHVVIKNAGSLANMALFTANGSVELYHNAVKKFETTGIGVSIVGTGNTATITGPSNLVLDPAAVGDNTGTVTILGNLQVDGTQTVINSTVMTVDDLNITLASGAANASAANGAGITVDGASATLTYSSTGDTWVFNKSLDVTGNTDTDTLNVSGVSTFGGVIDIGTQKIQGTNANYYIKVPYNANAEFVSPRPIEIRADDDDSSDTEYLLLAAGQNQLKVTSTAGGGTDANKLTYNGNIVWHAGNDGTGTGLDADTVDGLHAGSFLRSDAADTASGVITFSNGDSSFGTGTALSAEFGVNTVGSGAIKLHGTTSNAYGLIQATNSNLHLDAVVGSTYLNFYDGSFISFGTGSGGEGGRFTGSTQTLTLGTTSQTGTANQKLQVSGGAYVSGDVGIGLTAPTAKLEIPFNGGTASQTLRLGGTDNLNGDYIYAIGFGNPNNTQMGIGPHGTSRSIWNREGITHHIHQDDEWTIKSSSWTNQFGVQGGTGNVYMRGSVGIGTTNPTAKLTVDGSGTANTGTTIARFRNISSSNRIDIIDETTTGNHPPGILSPSASYGLGLYASNGPIRFYPNSTSTEKVRIDNSGNLLINTTSATGTSSQPLQVSGGAYISGNLGVGVANPGSTLAVGGTITELYNGSYWNVVTQADVGYGASQVPLNQYLGQLAFLDDHHPNGLRRDGGGSDDVVVSAGGTVGIGTDIVGSSGHALEVIGSVRINNGTGTALDVSNGGIVGVNGLAFNDPGPNEGITWSNGNGWSIYESPNDLTTNSAGNLQFVDSGSRVFTLDTSGNGEFTGDLTVDQLITNNNGNSQNVRIGDDVWIGDMNLANTLRIRGNQDQTQGYIVFGTSNATKLGRSGTGPLNYGGDFTVDGNLGIGSTQPAYKLDVTGDTNVTGYQYRGDSVKTASLFVRGTGLNHNSNRHVYLNGTRIVNTNSRGLTLTVIGAGLTHVSSTNYDTYGSATNATNLGTAIANINVGEIGVLSSYDAWELYVNDDLRTAALRVGLTKLGTYSGGGSRRPYAAVFYGTSDDVNGRPRDVIERMEEDDADSPEASIFCNLATETVAGSMSIPGAVSVNALYSSQSTTEGPTVIVDSDNNVGVGTLAPAYKLHVNGSFAATTKSFVIDHPTKDGMKLRYGSLEGPENGVYVRGRLKGNNTIELPDHWTGLVDEETITVNLTPIGRKAPLHSVVDIADNTVVVESANDVVDCFYTVFGERKDVEKLEVEF